MSENMTDPQAIKDRLSQIADAVADEATSLDDALSLYEEAIKLGLSACDLSEDIFASDEPEDVEAEVVEIVSSAVSAEVEVASDVNGGQMVDGYAAEEQTAGEQTANEPAADDPLYDPDRQ